MTTAESLDFPFLDGVPKREKTRVGKLLDVIAEIERVQLERGPVISQHVVADVLGLSPQRVSNLVSEGRLDSVRIGETRFVFLESFRDFAKKERPPGRPRKNLFVEAVRQGIGRGIAIGEAVVGER